MSSHGLYEVSCSGEDSAGKKAEERKLQEARALAQAHVWHACFFLAPSKGKSHGESKTGGL